MFKISDFVIPHYIISSVCKSLNTNMVDLYIEFIEANEEIYKIQDSDTLVLRMTDDLSSNYFRIIKGYFDNFSEIYADPSASVFDTPDQAANTWMIIQNYLNTAFGNKIELDKPVTQRLHQYPLVWNILSNLICPLFELECKNTLIVVGDSPILDVVTYFEDSEGLDSTDGDQEFPLIIINNATNHLPLKYALLLYYGIKSQGICPIKAMKVLREKGLDSSLHGLVSLLFDDGNDYTEFGNIYHFLTGDGSNMVMDESSTEVFFQKYKTAQLQFGADAVHSSFWYLGLIEKLLDVTRYENENKQLHNYMESFRDQTWKKIEQARAEKGIDGLAFEALLRIKDEKIAKPDDIKILENVLSSDRIW